MADEITEGLEQASSSIEINTSNLNKAVTNLNTAIESFSKSQSILAQDIGKISGSESSSKAHIRALNSMKTAGVDVGKVFSDLNNKLDISGAGEGMGSIVEKMVNSLKGLNQTAAQIKGFMVEHFDDIATAAKSAGVIGGISGIDKVLKAVDKNTGLFTIQKQLMALDRAVISAGTAFGGSFREAQAATNSFRADFADTIVNTRSSVKEIEKVRDALKDAFGSSDQLTKLGNLSRAQDNIRSKLSLTNTAILLSTSTGMDAGKIAEMMSEAHLELGESLEGSAKMFGAIQLAAEKSGMSFGKAADSIMKATDHLKMWGGTVGSVTPLFEAFTRQLGTQPGQVGLARKLLDQYTSKLAQMGLEMRALIGLQAPGGAGRGAIGVGLEMEAALEDKTGGGMQRVTENLIGALKRFTGGRVVTREQAIKNPAMERAFLVQRQLLRQMIGGDDASNTKMLAILQDIDAHGLQVGGDTESKLGEMLGSGEKARDATTDAMETIIQAQTASQMKQGEQIIASLSNILSALRADKVISAFQQTLGRVATTGNLSIDTIKDFGRFAGEGPDGPLAQFTEDIKERLGITEGDAEEQEVIQGGMRGQQTVSEAVEKLTAGLSERRQAVLEGGTGGFGNRAQERIRAGQDIGMGAVAEEFKEIMSPLQSQIKELRGRGELERPEQAQLMALESGLENLKRMSARRTINLGTGDPGRLSLNEADNTQALPFRQPPDTGTAEARKKLNIDLDLNVNVIQDANGVKIQADIDQEKFANQLKLELPNLLR